MSIIILTAPIQSGKTTLLQKYIMRYPSVGFLCPDNNGLRKLFDIGQSSWYDFEINKDDQRVSKENSMLTIGKFIFLKDTFALAQQILLDCSDNTTDDIIIDEIGKLELSNEGLEPALTKFIAYKKWQFTESTNSQKIILVIRATLLEACLQKYNLADAKILDIATFGSTFDLA
jgi:nucleoside-triphosphatase THEP1